MIEIENIDISGWEAAIRGMRNPLNSWDKSDSGCCQGRSSFCDTCDLKPDDDYAPCYLATEMKGKEFVVGRNDLNLMKQLVAAGSDHSKFMRMVNVTVDITAPLYWWKEMDTYKVGTVRNSCSTMHKITAKEFELSDFSYEHLIEDTVNVLMETIDVLNDCREAYINYDEYKNKLTPDISDKKDIWWQIIQLLPSSYNQRSTLQLNYTVLRNIYHSRKNHKLDEWHGFCYWIESLPYAKELICDG